MARRLLNPCMTVLISLACITPVVALYGTLTYFAVWRDKEWAKSLLASGPREW